MVNSSSYFIERHNSIHGEIKLPDNVVTRDDTTKPKACVGVRHAQVLMLSLAMVIMFTFKVNMAMAIVAMTDSSSEESFNWSIQTQSVILSSFFWGYVILQIPGGVLAIRYGGKTLIALAVGINSAVALLIPMSAHFGDWQLVCASRVVQGLAQGFLYSSIHCLIGKWVPLEERSRMLSFIYAGAQLGTAIQNIISGFIASSWGWPAIFYVNGAVGAIWTVVYVIIGASSPETSSLIGDEERSYIQSSLGHLDEQKKLSTPWKSILSSGGFISLVVAQSGHNWGHWTLQTEMPTYFKLVLDVDIEKNGVLSSLPYLGMFLLSFPIGFMSDHIVKKKWISITDNRKIFNSIGFIVPAFFLIGLTYAPGGNLALAVTLLTCVVSLSAGHYAGYLLVFIDLSPNFASILMGISNFVACVFAIIAPLAAGVIIQDQTNPADWHKVFYIAAAVYIATNLVFVLFASSDVQPWNEGSDDCDDRRRDTDERQVEQL